MALPHIDTTELTVRRNRVSEQRAPRFFGGREEIRKLLGEATEHTLEQVLLSLNSYNDTVVEAKSQSIDEPGVQRDAVLRLRHHIVEVENRIRQAASAVAPVCKAT
jgi:hypothetical protein